MQTAYAAVRFRRQVAIQASGKTKRVFVAECRGVPVATRVAAAVPAGKTGAYMCEKESAAAGFRAARTARGAAT